MSGIPAEPDRKVFVYSSYQDYISSQRRRARRTRSQTGRYAWHRAQISLRLHELCPNAKTMLCLGARNDVEVLDFERQGFLAQGIDLFPSERIVKCDMTKIDRHPSLAGKMFDIFSAIHSIEHCLDFNGFRRCLVMCNQALACVTPQISEPNSWDCSAFRFAHPDANASDIEQAFPGFRLAWRDVVKRTLMFVVVRADL